MFTKNFLFSVLRLALLSLVLWSTALALMVLAGAPSATAQAACTPGQTRTIWVDPHCCQEYPPASRTAQNQVCVATWVNDGATYCTTAPFCML